MGVFPGFGSWISKNSQQPLKAEAKGSENVESKSVSEKDTKNNAPAKKKKKKEYYDEKEKIRQEKLWHEEEEKHPWQNPPPKVKVTTKKGVYHMNLEITLGAPPELIYLWLIHPHGSSFLDEKKWRDLMITKSKKVLMEDGPREVFKVERSVVYDFFSLTSVRIPLHLIVEENRKDLTKMGVFPGFGSWINQNSQQPLKAESKRSENGESKSASEKDTNNAPAKKKEEVVYYDEKEDTRQGLWHEAEKKHPWHNPPPKIKGRKKSLKHNTILKKKIALVTNKKGLYHMNIELTVGMTPNIVYYVLTESDPFFDRKKWRDLMKNTSRKVLKRMVRGGSSW
ncbi:hypothetical protein Bca52824_076678 [Brassica carinata]|uniref:Uncharacterized protein n=2 Tax=Brassica TaxID=3705 RepID=A0A8X7TXJ2_BRACI|nr:hypothetical protein Bca52824_076678 [Brassica carinata]